MDLPQSRFADALVSIIRALLGYNQLIILLILLAPRTASAIPPDGSLTSNESTAKDWTNSARACDCRTDARDGGHDSRDDANVQRSV